MSWYNSNRYHWTVMQKRRMRSLYVAGYSLSDIAKSLGATRETIRYHLKNLGVTMRGRGMQTSIARAKYSGPKHHRWKGGRRLQAGYILLLKPKHPSAVDGYILEHRYRMELHLRRTNPGHPAMKDGFLRKTWIVHHKNRNKQDNRIRNLEPLTKGMHRNRHRHDKRQPYKKECERLRAILDSHGIPH